MTNKIIERAFVNELRNRLKEVSCLIQFVIGPRQVGKTFGIENFLSTYKGKFHYVLAEGEYNSHSSWLRLEFQKAIQMGEGTLLVIDEIQKIDNWSETIKSLWDQNIKLKTRLKCIFLGSSSLELQKGINESLAGRFEIIKVYHWDYGECLKLAPNLSLDKYLQMGGYPKALDYLSSPKRLKSYIKDSLIKNIIEKDILLNHTVKRPALFKQTIEILANYPSQEISYNKILGQLQDSGNVEIVKYYILLFEGAFLLRSIPKYHAKAILTKASSPKILPACGAIVYALANHQIEIGRLLEMAVGNLLLQIVDELFYWKDNHFELDFVAIIDHQVFAIEVKSGRNKKSKSLEHFLKLYPESIPIIVDQEEYLKMCNLKEDYFNMFKN